MRLKRKQRKNNANMLSTKRQVDGNIAEEVLQPEYHIVWSYHTMPLSIFFKQVIDDTVDKQIYLKFFNEIKDKQGQRVKKLTDDINLLQTKFQLAQLCVRYFELTDERDAEIMKVLSSFLAIRADDNLKVILTRSRGLLAEIDTKEKELKLITPKKSTGKIDYGKYFSHLINEVQKHVKYQIIKSETTVSEFAEMIIDLRNNGG